MLPASPQHPSQRIWMLTRPVAKMSGPLAWCLLAEGAGRKADEFQFSGAHHWARQLFSSWNCFLFGSQAVLHLPVLEPGPELLVSPCCLYSILHLSSNVSFNPAHSLGSTTKQGDEGPGDLTEREAHLWVSLLEGNIGHGKVRPAELL